MPEHLDVRDLQLVVGSGVGNSQSRLIRQGLHQFDVRVGEGAPGVPAYSEKAEEHLADPNGCDQHRARLAALTWIHSGRQDQARVVGEIRRPGRLSAQGDLVE